MKAKRFGAILATLVSAAACLSASAAWYDSPSIVKKVPLAKDSPTNPHFINKSEDDSILLVNVQSDGDKAPTLLFDISSLAAPSVAAEDVNVAKPVSKPSDGYGAEWKGGAVSAKLGIALMGGGNSSETCAIATKVVSWVKGAGLKPLSTANGYRIDGLDFSGDSSYLYSNFYADQNGNKTQQGKLLRWIYDAQAGKLVLNCEFQTSLTRIRNISVHTVNGKELVYCGEGTSTNAAAKVIAIDVSGDTWTEHVVSSGIEGLTGDITNVKLSNENDAHPVMYVLCDSGKLAVCRLAADGLSVAETVKTFDAAALHALAGGTTKANFRSFEVTKDGKTAFLVNRIDDKNANLCVLGTSAYIESDGTQFMNTGYYPSGKTKIEVDFQLTSLKVTEDCVFGNYGGNDDNFTVLLYANPDKTNFQLAGKDGTWQGVNTKVAVDTARHMVVIDVPKKQGTLYAPGGLVEGTVAFNDEWTYNNTAIWPIAFFASCDHASGTSARQGVKAKIYGAKIWESEDGGASYTLVHSYMPVVKGGIAGFLDSVTGDFLYDTRTTGAGTFAYGGDIETIDDDPYVESDGTSAINLGVSASPKLKIALDYALLEGNELQSRLLGEDSVTSAPRISIYINNSGNISLASGDSWDAESTGVATNTARRTAIIDNVAGKWAFMTGVTTNWSVSGKADLTKCATRPLAIFGNTNADDGSVFKQCTKMKVYGLKIWAGGELIRNLAPRCIDGVAGFEDVEGGGFYTCDGLVASENTAKEMTGPAYIESDGTKYSILDTRYFPNYKTKVEVDFQMVSVQSGVVPFGEYGASGFTMFLFCNTETPVKFRPQAQDATYKSSIDTPKLTCDVARHKLVMDVPARNIEMQRPGGAVEVKGRMPDSETYTGTSSWPLTLFGSASNAYGTTQKNAKARIYDVKIWESDDNGKTYTLRRHFKPALQGGIAGFYEEITGKFNSGEGFKAGGKIDECDETYIENNTSSKGSFDTGLKVTDKTKIVCDFMPLIVKNQMFPFEAGDSVTATNDQKRMFMRTYGSGSGYYAYACGGQLWKGSSIAFRQHIRRELTLDAKNNKFVIGSPYDNAVQTMTIAAFDCPNESSNTLKIFSNGTANGNYLQGRLYSFKVYEDDKLVGDYVPICQGGTYGLVDKVSGKVLTKASGSVAFAGLTSNNALNEAFFEEPMRAEDAYIESDGSQAINLEYYTTPNTRYEIDYQLTNRSKQYRPFGEADTSVQNLHAELYVQDSLNVAFGVGDKWKGHATGVASDTDRHVAFIDFANRECGYSGYKIFAFDSAVVCKNTAVVPMWLFAKGTNATGGYSNRAKMKLYAFRIYEAGKLVHEYLPYKNGDTVGLYDTMTGDVITSTVSESNAFTYGGGHGYGKFAGVKTVLTTEPADVSVKPRRTATLTAFAPGAVRYVWTRNGVVLAGATGSEVTVVWERPKAVGGTLVYGVTPVFLKDGVEVLGEEASAEVTMLPLGMVLILR